MSGTPTLNANTATLDRYMREVSRFPLLSREEECELARRYHDSRDPDARRRLINCNLRFVAKVAYRYASYKLDMIDLIQEGNVGLITAVDRFNPDHGNRLLTYAVWWIKATIQAHIASQWALVRVLPSSQQRKLLFGRHRDDAQDAEGNEVEGRDVVGWHRAASTARHTVDLDGPVMDGGSMTFGETLSGAEDADVESLVADAELHDAIHARIDALRERMSDKELVILEQRILSDDPATLQDLSDRFGISRERVRQVETGVKRRIERKLQSLVAA
jgi:RNA polymerase sigma-32 factor